MTFYTVALAWVCYHLLKALYNVSPTHPLSSFPVPKLVAATYFPELWYDVICTGNYTTQIRTMHEKYGMVFLTPGDSTVDGAELSGFYRAYCSHQPQRASLQRPKLRGRNIRSWGPEDLPYQGKWNSRPLHHTNPRGDAIRMSTAISNHSEEVFPDSNEFQPECWMNPKARPDLDRRSFVFGTGSRRCLGMK
ncbi:hypothetical protein JX266_011282 [Neoarthrinium moseri]|nr:hypothetical protein JX266_011282 [Neoarthrinium moseri]